MKRRILKMLIVLGALSVHVNVHAAVVDVASVPIPANAKLQMVSTNALHNGLSLSVATIQSSDSLAQSARFYRDLWEKPVSPSTPGFIESELNHWLLVSRLENNINTVVQLDTSMPDRTVGYISQTLVGPPVHVPDDRDFPELQVLSATQSQDGSVLSTITVYASRASVNATEQRSIRFLGKRGWSMVLHDAQGQSISLVFARGNARLEMVIARAEDYPALVVVNRVIVQ